MSKKIIDTMAILKGTAERVVSVVKKAVGKFNEFGEELVDGRAMEPPMGYVPSLSLAEQIANAVRNHAVQQAIADAGGETFEESEDFDVGDDFDPTSPYEAYFEPITERELEKLVKAGFEFPAAPPAEPSNGPVGPVPSVPPVAAPSAPQVPPAPAKAP